MYFGRQPKGPMGNPENGYAEVIEKGLLHGHNFNYRPQVKTAGWEALMDAQSGFRSPRDYEEASPLWKADPSCGTD
jgi:hypothetical protein